MKNARNRNTMHYRNSLFLCLLKIAFNIDTLQALKNIILEASVMHWRLCDITRPIKSDELISLMSQPLSQWLPNFVCQGYDGVLLADGAPSILASIIAYDLNYDDCWAKTQSSVDTIFQSLSSNGVKDDPLQVISSFLLRHPTIALEELTKAQRELTPHIISLYEPLSQRMGHNEHLYKCAICMSPYPQNSSPKNCLSSYCSGIAADFGGGEVDDYHYWYDQYQPKSPENTFTIAPYFWRSLYMPALIKNHFSHELDTATTLETHNYSERSDQVGLIANTSIGKQTIIFLDWTDVTTLFAYLEANEYSTNDIIVVPNRVREKIWRRGQYDVTTPEKLLRKLTSLAK